MLRYAFLDGDEGEIYVWLRQNHAPNIDGRFLPFDGGEWVFFAYREAFEDSSARHMLVTRTRCLVDVLCD